MRLAGSNRWRAGGGLFVAAAFVYVGAETVAALAWNTPRYSYATNLISDLGVPTCGPYNGREVCSPLHNVMNAGLAIKGLLFAGGAVLLSRFAARPRLLLLAAGLHAVGSCLVGGVPETTPSPWNLGHGAGALLAIVGGNALFVIAGSVALRESLPTWASGGLVVTGTVGICAFAYFVLAGAAGLPHPGGPGSVERLSVYAVTAGELLLGGWAIARGGAVRSV